MPGKVVKVRDHIAPPEKLKVVKVYNLTSFREEMAKIAKDFEQRIRIDALEELRVMVISKIESLRDEFDTSQYHKVIDMIAEAKRRAVAR